MVEQILAFFAQNPLYLGLGLLAGAALWLLTAALLSVLWPASEDPEPKNDFDRPWDSVPRLPSRSHFPSYEGPQALSPESPSPLWFKPSEPAAPAFARLGTFPAAPTNLAPAVVEEIPETASEWVLKERLESLAGKLESLEKTAPVIDLSHFDDRVARLGESLRDIHRSVQQVANFDEQRSRLEGRLDEISAKFLGRLGDLSARDSAEDALHRPVNETVRREIEEALERSRRERETILREIRDEEAKASLKAEEARRAEEAARQVRETLRLEEEVLAARRRELEAGRENLSREKADFERHRDAESRPVSLDELRAAQESLGTRLAALNARRESETARREEVLKRLHRRLERWQSAWLSRLSEDKSRWDAEWRALEARRAESLAKLGEEQARLGLALAALKDEEAALRSAQEDFRQNVVEAWGQEKNARDAEAQRLREQAEYLEAGIQDVQSRMAAEKERFESLILESRESLRTKQAEWREKLKSQRDDFEQKSAAAREDIARETAAAESEKAALRQKEEAGRGALDRQWAEWRESQAKVLEQIAREKEERNNMLAQWRARLRELGTLRQDLEAAYAAERGEQARQVDERRARTEQRLSTLQELLERVRKETAEQLAAYAREKNAVLAGLRRLREEFHQRTEAAAADLESRRKALETERREAEAEHASFLARSWDDEQKLQEEMGALERETAVLQKKLDVFRARRERVLVRLQERHERVLLRLHQEVDQVKVQGEARIAGERISLEAMKNRLANRQARLARIRQKQEEQLKALFDELNAALDLVRRGHRSESQVWMNRLKSLKNQRELLIQRRDSLRTTDAVAAKMQERMKQELQRYEEEERRLRNEREEYWKTVVEYSAINQEALRKMMEDLKGSGDDLSRREAVAMDILSRVREQLAMVRSFQKNLKPFDPEARLTGAPQ